MGSSSSDATLSASRRELRAARTGIDGALTAQNGLLMPGRERSTSPDALARPHLYDDERILWIERQPVRRTSALRLLLATPGLLLVAVASFMARTIGLRAGADFFIAALLLAALAWLWVTIYQPIKAYRGVEGVYAVLTDRRFLWVEALRDGTSRVRHPFRLAILRPGDLRSVSVRAHDGGAGEIRMKSELESGPRNARIKVHGDGRPVEEVAELLCWYLAIHTPHPRRRMVLGARP
jgi:hypothetical protein